MKIEKKTGFFMEDSLKTSDTWKHLTFVNDTLICK